MKQDHKHSILQVAYFTTVLVIVLTVSFLIFQPFITVLVVAGTIAVVVSPVYEKLVIFLRGRRSLASVITILLLIILIILPLLFLGRQVFLEAKDTYTTITSDVEGQSPFATDFIENKIDSVFPNTKVDLRQYVAQFTSWFIGNVGNLFSGTLDIVLKIFLGFIAMFYFLKDGSRFKKELVQFSPLPDEYDTKIFTTLQNSMRSIIKGSLVISVIQGVLSGLGFWIFGVPNPALWGIVTAICALVPGFGTSLVLIPAVIYLFATSTLAPALGLAIWAAVIVGTIDNFLSPILIERGIKIHPLFILFSIIGGLTFFGPGGFILGPLVLSLLFTLFDIYHLFIQDETNQTIK